MSTPELQGSFELRRRRRLVARIDIYEADQPWFSGTWVAGEAYSEYAEAFSRFATAGHNLASGEAQRSWEALGKGMLRLGLTLHPLDRDWSAGLERNDALVYLLEGGTARFRPSGAPNVRSAVLGPLGRIRLLGVMAKLRLRSLRESRSAGRRG